ncbi:MAG: hypothetical protein IT334_11530 [Thermomicrobiales bacterium]|nr:hypothetical protein [Thermomicrobiales bacterium]
MTERGTGEAARAAALRALAWVREMYPGARMTTEVISTDDALVPVLFEIATMDGPAGAGHGVALGVEEAEDRAILRAAETLGYRDEEAVPTAEPDPIEGTPPPPLETVQHSPATPLAGRAAQLGPSVMVRPRTQPATSQPPRPIRPVAPPEPPDDFDPGDDADLDMEDVSWTAFWKWARAQGYDSGEAVARAIGRPIQGLSPREVRDLLRSNL